MKPPTMSLPSASAIAATASSGVHILKLRGYSQAKLLLGTGAFIESAKFEAAGHSWRIKVYPNGSREESAAAGVSLYLVLASEYSKDVHAHFQFSFVRHGSKLAAEPPPHAGGGRTSSPSPVTFTTKTDAWGFDGVETSEELETPEFLKDDAILIRCDITVLDQPVLVKSYDLDTLELLCDCDDDGPYCTNLHAGDDGRPPRSHHRLMPTNYKTLTGYSPLPRADAAAPPPPSASAIAVTASTGCHVMRVSGYSQTKLLLGTGEYVTSAKFTEAGHTWRIRCYPNGDRKESAGYMSLYLELVGDYSTDVHAVYELSLAPHGGKLTETPRDGVAAGGTFLGKNDCWGVMEFMASEELERSEYLKDDSFIVRCDITVMNKPVVKRQDLEKLQLLCDCDDDGCKYLHVVGDREPAAAKGKPSCCLALKKMLRGCLPIRAQSPEFKLE